MKRTKFSGKIRASIALLAACSFAAWVSYGPHLRRVTANIIDKAFYCAPQYVALKEYHFELEKPAESVVRCAFGGISFEIPSALADQSKVFRESPSSIWLVFEDRERFMQIPLSNPAPGSMISAPPPELENTTVPTLLAKIVAVSSDDFLFALTRSELRVYEWAIENRKNIALDGLLMDRYAVRSSETLDAIFVSADPNASLPERHIRSVLVWQAAKYGQSGLMHFGHSAKGDAKWITALVTSIGFVPGFEANGMAADALSTMADDAILSMLKFDDPS